MFSAPDFPGALAAGPRLRPTGIVAAAITLTLAVSPPVLASQKLPSAAGDGLEPTDSGYQVSIDIDGDGEPDEITIVAGSDGRTRVAVVRARGGSASFSVPFRGPAGSVPLGERLVGAAPLTHGDRADLVFLTREGECGRHRIVRWRSGRPTVVPNPRGGKQWRVCGLGVSPVGRGYRSVERAGRHKMITFVGREVDGRVRMRRTVYRWTGPDWRQLKSQRMWLATSEALPVWGMDFPWRTS